MSRFADATNTRVVALGDCQCPGSPHAQDEATVYRELGYGAKDELNRAGWISGRGIFFDTMAARRRLVELAVKSWNLLGPDGKDMPPSEATIALLDEETVEALAEAADEALVRTPLPNESGAPSADSSPASASPTPETSEPASSTTP